MKLANRLRTYLMWGVAEFAALNPLRLFLRLADAPFFERFLHRDKVLLVLSNEELWKYEELRRELASRGVGLDIFFAPHDHDFEGVKRAKGDLQRSELEQVDFKFGWRLLSIWRYRTVIFNLPYLLPSFPFRINFVPRDRLFYTPYTFDLLLEPPESHFGKRGVRLASVAASTTWQAERLAALRSGWSSQRIAVCGFPGINVDKLPQTKAKSDGTVIWAPHYSSISADSKTLKAIDAWVLGIQSVEELGLKIIFRPHPQLRSQFEIFKHKLDPNTVDYLQGCFLERMHRGSYRQIFRSSLTLIHNSVSFIGEHLNSGRKAIYWTQNSRNYARLNHVGLHILEMMPKASTPEQLLEQVTLMHCMDGNETPQWSSPERARLKALGLGLEFEKEIINFMNLDLDAEEIVDLS